MRHYFFKGTILFLAITIFNCNAMEEIMYEGLRLDLSALTMNRDIIATIIPGLQRTLAARFSDIEESGSFWSKLRLHNIRITYYKVNEERFNLTGFEFEYPIYRMKGAFEAIYFHVSFEYIYTWLGMTVSKGTGGGSVTNLRSEILVLFNETDPDVIIPHPWDVKNVTLSSTWLAPTSWARHLLHNHFIEPFHKAVDDAMFDFAHNLLKTYRYIEDIFPHDIDLVFKNDIIEVRPTVGGTFLSIAFKTNITVNNYIIKKMHRRMPGVIVPQGDFDYCLPAQLVPDVLDALGKGGYYDTEVPASLWGFETDQIHEFFSIIPSLKERYKGDEQFAIHCQSSRFEAVNDITQRGALSPSLELQNPTYCFVYMPYTGEYFLMVDIFMRLYYEMKNKDESYYGHVMHAHLYGFKTLPALPESKMQILESKLEMFTDFFQDSELISPGIKVIPNRHKELKYDWGYIMEEEICFYYKELKPISPNKN